MNPIDIAERYFKAHNGRDLQELGVLLSDEPEFELAGVWTLRGRAKVLRLAEWDAALNAHLEPADLRAEGGIVSCQVTERNDWFSAVGIGRIRYERSELHVVGGRIVRIRAVMEPEGFTAVAEVLARITDWARQACPEELGELMPAGHFEYNAPNAGKWLALLARWREAKESTDYTGGEA